MGLNGVEFMASKLDFTPQLTKITIDINALQLLSSPKTCGWDKQTNDPCKNFCNHKPSLIIVKVCGVKEDVTWLK